MNIFYKSYCRIYQKALKFASKLVPWPTPKVIRGANSLSKVHELIASENLKRVIIVTDKIIASFPFTNDFIYSLSVNNISYVIYDNTVANPTINNIEDALKLYEDNNCEGIIALGGGSAIDCAKALGARVSNKAKPIIKMKGLLKVKLKLPPLFAIPTTAGTGSEATIAAVISNPETHEKYAINDMKLIPKYAILDPLVTINLPKNITSTTGMDALTHAIEAYIGKSSTKETRTLSKMAIKLIYENIYEAYNNGENLVARENMQLASYYAGLSFTKAYVGYVHAIAHTLGGYYSIPHGLANAVILPYVLEAYDKSVHKKLDELSDHIGLTAEAESISTKSTELINSIKDLNTAMDICNKITCIDENDIPTMAKRALKEAHPLYPVPKLLDLEAIMKIYYEIKE